MLLQSIKYWMLGGDQEIIQDQLDHRTSPCNLAMLIPRLKEV